MADAYQGPCSLEGVVRKADMEPPLVVEACQDSMDCMVDAAATDDGGRIAGTGLVVKEPCASSPSRSIRLVSGPTSNLYPLAQSSQRLRAEGGCGGCCFASPQW